MRKLYFDLETTGLKTHSSKIVQIGVLLIDGEDEKTFNILIDPEIPIPDNATYVHKITDDMVKGQKKFRDVADKLYSLFLSVDVVLGYNINNYDIPLLYTEFLRCGLILPELNTIDVYDEICMIEPNKKLSSVYARYCGKNIKNAHDALVDVLVTREVWDVLEPRLKF